MMASASKGVSVFFITTAFVILPAHALQSIYELDVRILYSLVIFSCVAVILIKGGVRFGHDFFVILLFVNMLGLLGSLLSGVDSQWLMSVSLSAGLFVVWFGLVWYVNSYSLFVLNMLCIALLAGGAIGIAYAYLGGAPQSVTYIGDRSIMLYLTTYSLYEAGGIIRPSGIFDEPGAFAMFVTAVISLNELFRYNRRWTKGIALLGLITGSFTQFIITALYFSLTSAASLKRVSVVAIMLCLLALSIELIEPVHEFVDYFFFKRLEMVDGRLAGDNRTHQIESSFELVDVDIMLKGQRVTQTNREGHDLSSNPFTILMFYGVFIWLPYLFIELWLLFCVFTSRKYLVFPSLACFLTLLQRPYIYNQYWTLIILVVIVSIYKIDKVERKIKDSRAR